MHPEDFVSLFRKYRSNSFLEKTDEYEESLLAAFKAIYNSLKDKEQTVFNQLAVFPTSFDAIASSQVCEESGSCLKSLSQFGLVKTNPVPKTFERSNSPKRALVLRRLRCLAVFGGFCCLFRRF